MGSLTHPSKEFFATFDHSPFGHFSEFIQGSLDEGSEQAPDSIESDVGAVRDVGDPIGDGREYDFIYGSDLVVGAMERNLLHRLIEGRHVVHSTGGAVEEGDDFVLASDFVCGFSERLAAASIGIPLGNDLEAAEVVPDPFELGVDRNREFKQNHNISDRMAISVRDSYSMTAKAQPCEAPCNIIIQHNEAKAKKFEWTTNLLIND